VEIEFAPDVAPYVQARVWHPSQDVRENGGGRVRLTMDVCHDWALRSWILSWGPFARVVSPAPLAAAIRADLEAAGTHYRS
jgi:predicted DNA-binding transcriptional regulator YafY